MKKFLRQAARIADSLVPGQTAHFLIGKHGDIEEFISDMLAESAVNKKQIESLTAARQMDIMLSPDEKRRHRIIKLLVAVANVKLKEWPLILPLWIVVALKTGFDVCEAIYLIRTGYVRVKGERQWLAEELRGQTKVVRESFIEDEEDLESMEDDDDALKFSFNHTISNPDSLMLCRRKKLGLGPSFETLDEVIYAKPKLPDDAEELPDSAAPHPTFRNLFGFLDSTQVNKDSKLLSWLHERSLEDATICWPMVYFDIAPFWKPREESCKEVSS